VDAVSVPQAVRGWTGLSERGELVFHVRLWNTHLSVSGVVNCPILGLRPNLHYSFVFIQPFILTSPPLMIPLQ